MAGEANPDDAGLRGPSITLRPVLPSDVEFLYGEEVSSALAFRWRLGGVHPSPYTYGESLWSGVLASFIATDRSQQQRLGIFTAYASDDRNQFAYVATALLSEAPSDRFRRARIAVEGTSLLIEYLYKGWPFRKLYLEIPEFNLPQFASMLDHVAVEEGRLKSHIYHDGNWWDQLTVAIWRDTWEPSELRERLLLRE